MKKTVALLLVLLSLSLTACVNESPEPFHTVTVETGRHVVYSDVVNTICYSVYSDNTCEITGLAEPLTVTELILPDFFDEIPVIAIHDETFAGCGLTRVVLPSFLQWLGDGVFRENNMEEIVLPDTVTSIGKECFDNCINLKKVTFSKSLKTIPLAAFYSCVRLQELVLPEGLVSIEEEAFGDCQSLTRVSLPSTLKRIGPWAFWNSGTDDLSFAIPEGVEEIGRNAFTETAWLKNQTAEFFTVGDGVLLKYNGTATTVTVPDTVKYLSAAFDRTPVTHLILPDVLQGACAGALTDSNVTDLDYNGPLEEIRNLLEKEGESQ